MKQRLELRPVHHRKQERIRAHVTLCFLGLMLMRVAERARRETPGGTFGESSTACTSGTSPGRPGRPPSGPRRLPAEREILRALEIAEPPVVLELSTPRPRRAKRPA